MFWTIQRKEVLDIIESNGAYYPDFDKSDMALPGPYRLMHKLFKAYNKLNDEESKGLVFTFDNTPTNPLTTIEEAKTFLSNSTRQSFIYKKGNNIFEREGYYLLCLEGFEGYNTLPIDVALFTGLSDILDESGSMIPEYGSKGSLKNDENLYLYRKMDELEAFGSQDELDQFMNDYNYYKLEKMYDQDWVYKQMRALLLLSGNLWEKDGNSFYRWLNPSSVMLHSNIMEKHLPYIKEENITSCTKLN